MNTKSLRMWVFVVFIPELVLFLTFVFAAVYCILMLIGINFMVCLSISGISVLTLLLMPLVLLIPEKEENNKKQ